MLRLRLRTDCARGPPSLPPDPVRDALHELAGARRGRGRRPDAREDPAKGHGHRLLRRMTAARLRQAAADIAAVDREIRAVQR
ncbi:hypothetical protein GCM10011392_36230 [Wenxinia marina]|nr:hypothetical protein GCM10011392_36230 [Wenxinia marina]